MKRKRTKTFNTDTKKGLTEAYRFLKSRPKSSDASMESYRISGGKPRAVVIWHINKRKYM